MAKSVVELKCRVALISIAPRYGAAWACELRDWPKIVRAPALVEEAPGGGENVIVLDHDFEAIGP
jgi:hypothetical protein